MTAYTLYAITGEYGLTGATVELKPKFNYKLVLTPGQYTWSGEATLFKGAEAFSISTPPATMSRPTRFIPELTAEILSQVIGPTSVSSTTPMRVRKLDKNGDMCFGHGQQDFWRNVPDGPAQCAYTRLVFWKGEWFLDKSDGTDWNNKVLGKHTETTRDPEIILRVSLTQGVKEVLSYSSWVDRNTRQFGVGIKVDTIFGPVEIQGPI